MFKKHCIECAAVFQAKKADARFCSTGCRKEFNNRRMTRGAMLYDAFMAMRYDRKAAEAHGVDYTFVCRIAEMFRADDEKRTQKQTWRPTREFVEENAAMINSRRGAI
jgi:predicted nucleic acid-binding Zn ribbon protein